MTATLQQLRTLIGDQHRGFLIQTFELLGEGLETVAIEAIGNEVRLLEARTALKRLLPS